MQKERYALKTGGKKLSINLYAHALNISDAQRFE